MCRPRKITGIFEPIWDETRQALSVGDIVHYNDIRFDEMGVVPVLPRTIYMKELQTEALKLPEIIKYCEVIEHG